jgi:hypothetical protein
MGLPKLFMISPKKGAETIVYLASAQGIDDMSGEYFEKKRVKRSSEESYDRDVAKNLWDHSMHLAYQ